MKVASFVSLIVLGCCANPLHAEPNRAISDLLASAKPGQTVEVPAGEFKGGVTVPPGVSLKGAGFDKTIIDAAGDLNGIMVEGGSGARISDLTVRNAKGAGVTIRNATSTTLARVRVTKGASGLMFRQVRQGRIENCLIDHNSFGIAVSRGADCAVVNCTVADCTEIGLSLAACPNLTVFNNCVIGSAVCLNIDQPEGMRVDHNLYFGTVLGRMREQLPRKMLTAWQYLTGLDAHSLQTYLEFKNLDAGDCTPTTVPTWCLDRAATGDWGVAELAGVKAPDTDMFGHPRAGGPDIGAVETVITPPRAADGKFTVSSDVGIKSAGVFTKNGNLIAYLFQNMPLPKGTYSFWLPVRDYVGQPIPAGEYDVRLAESDFRWKYINHVGDNGEDRPMPHSASFNPQFVAFAPGGRLVMQEGLSEDHAGLRAYDVATGKLLWFVMGSGSAQGIGIDQQGMVYALIEYASQKNESRLTRVDTATGKIVPWPNSKEGHNYPILSPKARSLAVLDDRFYVADEEGGKLIVFDKAQGTIVSALNVKSPKYVASDQEAKLLWVISGEKLLAYSPDGNQVAESSAVEDPISLAARGRQLTVASAKTGKLHWFDASDPKNLKSTREFGRGDGPYGQILPDRFMFQKAAKWNKPDETIGNVALGPDGQFAVVDVRRTLAFDSTGKNLWYTVGVFGSWSHPSFSTENRRLWDSKAEITFLLNEKDGTWVPEAIWDHTLLTPEGLQELQCIPLGDFKDGDKAFFVSVSCAPGAPFGPPNHKTDIPILTVARIDGFKTIPVLTITAEGGNAVMREDTNGDGMATKEDAGRALLDAQGKPMPATLFFRFVYLEPDGSIIVLNNTPSIWKRTGLNAKGVPVYEGKNYLALFDKDWKKDLSPYDFKPDYAYAPGNGFVVPGMLSDGGFVLQATVRGSGGSPMNNGAGTDLCGYGPDGRRRWMHPLAQYRGIAGMGTVDDITLTAAFANTETITVDADGLALGGFCEPKQLYYPGYWIDQPNIRLFKMPDDHLHATIGDDCSGRHPWFRLDNQESLNRTKQSFQVSTERAREIAGLEFKPSEAPGRPPSPKLRIKRLEQPLTIDGDLAKWRNAGVEPQIVMGPSGSFNGPGDCSAVIRMAYEGQNLYFQVLQFDDIPIFYKTVYQNSVELGVNPPSGSGFQFVVHKTPEGKDMVWRNRFFANMALDLDPQHAPRMIRVLPNAKDVPEREVLEGLYGEDLSNAKVVVTEFKLPIDKTTFSGAEGDVFQLGPGKTFGVGFFVDDSDEMYIDDQRLISWPATFHFFCTLDDQAQVTCE